MIPNFLFTKFSFRLITRIFIPVFIFLLAPTKYQAQIHNWTKINTGYFLPQGVNRFVVTPNCVYFFNSYSSKLIRSLDRGVTWDSIYVPSDSSHHEYKDMDFVNDSTGYIVGLDGSEYIPNSGEITVIKKTVDRGQTWTSMRNGIIDNSMLLHVNFFDENHGIVFGTGNVKTHLFQTFDGGANWVYFQDNPYPNEFIAMPQINCSSFTGTHAFISGVGISANGRIARSHDAGQTWSTVQLNSSYPSGMRFFNGSDGIVVVNDSILVTNDGATSFSARHKFPYSTFIRSFDMIDIQKGFFCNGTNIYYTPDAGVTWFLSYSGTDQLVSVKICDNQIYAATFNEKYVLKLDITSLVSIVENTIPEETLSIFPNPAISKIHIKLPATVMATKIVVSDQLGRIVQIQTVDENQTLDVNMLTPGIYTLLLYASSHTYIKKLVIADHR